MRSAACRRRTSPRRRRSGPVGRSWPARSRACRGPSAILALGRIAQTAALAALGQRLSAFKFGHGARHDIVGRPTLFDSYHCSRYNTQTGVLTEDMFRLVFEQIRRFLAAD